MPALDANFEDTTSQLKASVMLIVKFKVPMEEGSVVVKLNPEFIKYFFMMANVSTLGEIMCECQETGGGEAAIAARSHPVDFTTNLKPLVNVSSEKGGKKDGKRLNFYFIEHLIPILLAALWVNFVVLFYWTMKIAEIDEQTSATAVAPENKAGNKEVYILIFQTSYVQVSSDRAMFALYDLDIMLAF
ncbi:hypothetical protein IscW_ISCW011466 [Ixodes scapularis]|uniref:Uncharacterized protein n=1 Tax=Ixodes scapularis TaxID=6945 RepID=B7Q8M3_IXOSC|nr:hypothetical protein IscW_ISCW011466 [Ixodes scapularis]|eukprot:XP_002412380.1 hypothetical protein IscW_ISCW011466 [Ixodes scapularis]